MRVSLRWIREFLPGLSADGAEVARRLTLAGLEVEAVREIGAGLEALVVAEVRAIDKHPKRDSLSLVTVDRGGAEQRVVCGASNVPAPGGLVVLAPVGTTLSAVGLTLTPREIGGVMSEGMLCSEQELGVAEDSEGILVLPAGSTKAGTPFLSACPEARDTVLEIGVTPNRPDALGHVGVARELSALFGLKFAPPAAAEPKRVANAKLDELITIENRDLERCPHYGAAAVLNVKIAPSPHWVRWRLSALGVRPISNVVDVTNLLLLGWGQPMHAFDLDRVKGARIVVRRAEVGEPFTTLDGEKRTLHLDDLVICDAEAPSALAGVMGGLDSEIKDDTTRVLLECAYFHPRGVRRTARRHGLHTESSFRFERGVDRGAIPLVLDHAKALLESLCGGEVVPGAIHAQGDEAPPISIHLRSRRLDALLGVAVPFAEATATLAALGFTVRETGTRDGDAFALVDSVSWRPDIQREVDLIEEVARVRGLDAIPTVLPAIAPQLPRTTGQLEREAAREAASLGLSEAVTYAFVSPKELQAVRAPEAVVALVNPLTEERSVMRTSLLPGLLEALRRARRRGERSVRLFTLGARFLPRSGNLPEERSSFAAVLAGPRPTYLKQPDDVDVWDAKGIATEIAERLTRRTARVEICAGEDDTRHLHPRGAGRVLIGDTAVGTFGPLHPDVIDALDLDGDAQIVELDLAALQALGKATPRYRPIPRLPPVTRDLALVVKDDVPAETITQVIRDAAGDLCESVELFDLFRGGSVPAGHRSLAFHLVYRDPKSATDPDAAKTLTDREVDQRHALVIKATSEKLGGQLRA